MSVNVLIRYTVAPDKVAANEAAVSDFIAAVKAAGDPEAEYSSYRLDDTSFVHIGRFADEDAVKRFQAHEKFDEFANGLRERAVEGPDAARLTQVATTRD